MSAGWPLVPLGTMLRKTEQWVDIVPGAAYRQVTVRLWGQGAALRDEVDGAAIASNRRCQVQAGSWALQHRLQP